MKRFLSVCLCLVLCATLLCGCPRTPPDTSDPSSGTTPTTKPTTTPTTTPTRPIKNLPQADEQTIRWTLEMPDDLKVAIYQTPQLVAPEDFSWGEYVPFVAFEGETFAKGDGHYDRAFLGPNAPDLQQGQRLYQAFNDLYKTVYPTVYGSFEYPTQWLPEDEALRQFLFESSVVAISPDLQRVETFGYLYKGVRSDPSDLDLYQQAWATEYKIHQNGQRDLVYQSPELDYFYDTVDYQPYYYQRISRFQDTVRYPDEVEWRDGKYLFDKVYIYEKPYDVYSIYSIEEDRMLYQVTEGLNCEIDGYTVYASPYHFVVNGRYMPVGFFGSKEVQDDFLTFRTLYLFDLQTGEWQFLEDFAFDPSFSPDGKYLAYTNWINEETHPDQPSGFYVKNLQDGTTTYYAFEPHEGLVDRTPHTILGFVHYDTLMQTIGNQR